ncbi:MAG: dagA [Chlamydiia bacterium]|nr:dagA [Chlamydiia bacterium]
MIEQLFDALSQLENILWSYFGFPAILLIGGYLTVQSRFVQIRKFPAIVKTFFSYLFKTDPNAGSTGIHPIKAFFAGIGGAVGIGNIVGVATAVQLGGPGAIFWIWVTAMIGALVKYSEVYLGMRHRVEKGTGGEKVYRGGPMYVLARAFKGHPWVVKLFCVLLCIYGVEIFQFSVMTSSISENFGFSKMYVALIFLALVMLAEAGGVARIGSISGTIIPVFIVIYLGMGSYVLISNISAIPTVIADVFRYAFTPHAAIGAFAGSTLMMSITQGIRRACYSCDIGVGYASIIHSESSVQHPAKQASLTIFEVFIDAFVICTMSLIIVLVTGTWTENIDSIYLVQSALSKYFPYMNLFIPVLLFILGYSTVITYFCAGMKTALHLSPRYGRILYYCYSIVALMLFSFVDTTQANGVMSCVLAMLLTLNLAASWRLRHEISFDVVSEEENAAIDMSSPQMAIAD